VLLGVLSGYWLIVLAHWRMFLDRLFFLWPAVPGFIFVLAMALLALLGPAYKKLHLLLGTIAVRRVRVRTAIIVYSGAVLVGLVIVTCFGAPLVGYVLKGVVLSPYLYEYCHLWASLAALAVGLALFASVRARRGVETFLRQFKTFPLVSPLFCFGAPAFWAGILGVAGLPNYLAGVLTSASALSGLLLSASVIVYYIGASRSSQESPVSSTEEATAPRSENGQTEFVASLALLSAGMTGLVFVCLETGFWALRHAMM
jgi:hypothetical protein